MTKAVFIPLKWSLCCDDDEVAMEGHNQWYVGDLTHSEVAQINISKASLRDNYRFHPNAPQWVQRWRGLFDLYLYNDDETIHEIPGG